MRLVYGSPTLHFVRSFVARGAKLAHSYKWSFSASSAGTSDPSRRTSDPCRNTIHEDLRRSATEAQPVLDSELEFRFGFELEFEVGFKLEFEFECEFECEFESNSNS